MFTFYSDHKAKILAYLKAVEGLSF